MKKLTWWCAGSLLALGTLAGAIQIANAQGLAIWNTYEDRRFGIRLSVPDSHRCQTDEVEGVGVLECDYGDIVITVIAIREHLGANELRAVAASHVDIPPSYWRWEANAGGADGYLGAEAWSASFGGQTVLGLLGQSAVRPVSHIVFIEGTDDAWVRDQGSIATFIENVTAI